MSQLEFPKTPISLEKFNLIISSTWIDVIELWQTSVFEPNLPKTSTPEKRLCFGKCKLALQEIGKGGKFGIAFGIVQFFILTFLLRGSDSIKELDDTLVPFYVYRCKIVLLVCYSVMVLCKFYVFVFVLFYSLFSSLLFCFCLVFLFVLFLPLSIK